MVDGQNAPGTRFYNGTIISDSADFFLEQERGKYPSQYFMAASAKHPLSYFMAQQAIERLLKIPIIATQFTAQVTGPGATKTGMVSVILYRQAHSDVVCSFVLLLVA